MISKKIKKGLQQIQSLNFPAFLTTFKQLVEINCLCTLKNNEENVFSKFHLRAYILPAL